MDTYTVSHYLLDRLSELGIKHIFGVPGDHVLGFVGQIEADDRLSWVANCNELNAAYAAEAHGRTTGAGPLVVHRRGRRPLRGVRDRRGAGRTQPDGRHLRHRSRSGTVSATSTTVSATASAGSNEYWRRSPSPTRRSLPTTLPARATGCCARA
jgi:hypothetical protein